MSYRWSEEEFQAKVTAQAEAKGVTVRAILRKAKVSEDTFNHPPANGRRLDTILRIAAAADMEPADALGLSAPADDSETGKQLARLALVADVAAHLYVALAGRAALKSDDLKALTPDRLIEAIMALITNTTERPE